MPTSGFGSWYLCLVSGTWGRLCVAGSRVMRFLPMAKEAIRALTLDYGYCTCLGTEFTCRVN